MAISLALTNRLGFILLGLSNNFAYVIMLSAAYDLLKQLNPPSPVDTNGIASNVTASHKFCNAHSTSTILLADTLPSLATKIAYPFFLVNIPTAYKAVMTAILSAAAFIIAGLSASQLLLFTGVVCASFSSGLGESTYLSNTPLYGDVSLSGWSMGTGAAGLLGAAAYALLSLVFPIRITMFIMLVVPVIMCIAYYYIKPIGCAQEGSLSSPIMKSRHSSRPQSTSVASPVSEEANLSVISRSDLAARDQHDESVSINSGQHDKQQESSPFRSYGSATPVNRDSTENNNCPSDGQITEPPSLDTAALGGSAQPFDFHAKLRYMPSLAKYFLPLLLVYFAEYFINQGLFELVYYPDISYLDHAAQYRWYQVCYQLGVMISRSSLDLIRIKNLWTMSLLQAANAILFLAHASKLIYIPSFYLVTAIIVYEGLLGGFTYVNTFYRVKKEVSPEKQEFCISTVTAADSLGIVFAGLVAIPVHEALCKLYD